MTEEPIEGAREALTQIIQRAVEALTQINPNKLRLLGCHQECNLVAEACSWLRDGHGLSEEEWIMPTEDARLQLADQLRALQRALIDHEAGGRPMIICPSCSLPFARAVMATFDAMTYTYHCPNCGYRVGIEHAIAPIRTVPLT